MKKYIKYSFILLIISGISSCQTRSYNNQLIVKKVELNELSSKMYEGKYKVTIEDKFAAILSFNTAVYTDSLYLPGDTIKLTK